MRTEPCQQRPARGCPGTRLARDMAIMTSRERSRRLKPQLTANVRMVKMNAMRKNILLIICDQLSAQALTAWGNSYGRTPNIDKIIENGVRFERAYTNCPLCQPSRASFWTGLYPHQTGVLSNGHLHPVPEVQESVATLGSVFSKAGYQTVHCRSQVRSVDRKVVSGA